MWSRQVGGRFAGPNQVDGGPAPDLVARGLPHFLPQLPLAASGAAIAVTMDGIPARAATTAK